MGSVKESNRIDWVDYAKGISVLLVILGHTISSSGSEWEKILRGGIFSIHMPVFFILSGLTFSLSANSNQFCTKMQKAFKHLVITAIALYVLRVFGNIIFNFKTIDWTSYVKEKLLVLFYASGGNVETHNMIIPAFGMMWFLIVLFCARTLFDYLHLQLDNKKFCIIICICAVVGVGLGKIQWLPFSFDITLAVMPFMFLGNYLKNLDMDNGSISKGIICGGVWLITFTSSYAIGSDYLELAGRRYPYFPLCYITACAGSLFVFFLSKVLVAYGLGAKSLIFIGKNSIYLYCVHAMDYVYGFIWNRTGNNFVNGIIRIVVDIIVCILLMRGLEIIWIVAKTYDYSIPCKYKGILYRKFTDNEEAISWGEKNYSYWLPRYQIDGELRDIYETENLEYFLCEELSQNEIERLKEDALEYVWFSAYCGGNYGLEINRRLRFGYSNRFSTDKLDQMQRIMDSRLDNSYIPENIIGYRFLAYNDLCMSNGKRNIKIGDLILDNGYMGVGLVKESLKEEFGEADTLLKILIPKRAKGLYVDLISNRTNEQEVLFARGRKLRVLFIYRFIKKRIIICKMIE